MIDLERMARECIAEDWDSGGRYYRNMDLARFADLIRADERERCAKVCDPTAAITQADHAALMDAPCRCGAGRLLDCIAESCEKVQARAAAIRN
jgi:hypothetical protein